MVHRGKISLFVISDMDRGPDDANGGRLPSLSADR